MPVYLSTEQNPLMKSNQSYFLWDSYYVLEKMGLPPGAHLEFIKQADVYLMLRYRTGTSALVLINCTAVSLNPIIFIAHLQLLKASKRPSHSSTPQPASVDAKHVVRRSDDASGGARKPLSSLAPGMNGGATNGRLLVPGSGLTLANAPATPPSPAGNGSAPSPKPGATSQKRNDFFKALRKKALSPKDCALEGNGVAVEGGSEHGLSNNAVRRSESPEASLDGRRQGSAAPNTSASPPHEAPSIPHSNGSLTKAPNGYANGVTNGVMNGVIGSADLGALRHNQDEVELVGEPEGEEAALLRSLGWTGSEDDDQEGALTEEEIRSFFSQVRPPSC
jgi:hypothetical protein